MAVGERSIAAGSVADRSSAPGDLRLRALLGDALKERASFHCACLYLFFEYVRPQTIYPAIDFFPWTAFFAVTSLLLTFTSPCKYSIKEDGIGRMLFAFGAVVLLSSLLSEYPSESLHNLDSYFSWMLIYFAIVRSVVTPRQYLLFFLLYLLCNFKMTQHGFLSWAQRGFAFDSWGVVGGPGWFHNSGEFGIQLCIFAPMAGFFVAAIWRRTGRMGHALFLVMPLSAVFCALASSSRGAVVGLFVASVWLARRVRHIIPVALLLSFLTVLTITFTPQEFKERFESMGSDKTSTHRLDRWEKGLDTVLKYPFLGVGHAAWVPYYKDYLDYGQPGSPLVHNIFVQCATELGLTGLFVFIVLIIRMLRTTNALRLNALQVNDRYGLYMAQGLETATIGLLASSMFVTVLYYPFIWVHAAFVAAFAQSLRRRIAAIKDDPSLATI